MKAAQPGDDGRTKFAFEEKLEMKDHPIFSKKMDVEVILKNDGSFEHDHVIDSSFKNVKYLCSGPIGGDVSLPSMGL